MSRKLSLFISILFHPVFVNLFSLLMLFVLFPYLQYVVSNTLKLFYILFIFITTGIFPVIAVGILKLMGKTSSVLLDEKEERTIPYIITACIYLFDYYFFLQFGAPALLNAYLLACASIVVLVLLVNKFNKISIHAASLGALMAVVISGLHVAHFDVRILLALIIFLSGLTASARLFANAHIPQQLYTGFLLGLSIMLFIL